MIKTMSSDEYNARIKYADAKKLTETPGEVILPEHERVLDLVNSVPLDAIHDTDLVVKIIERKYDLKIEPRTTSVGEYGFIDNISIIFNGCVYPHGSEVTFIADYRLTKHSYKIIAINWLSYFFSEKYSEESFVM